MLRTILLCTLAAASMRADSLITINTAGLFGTSGDLVFDFISGGGPEQNAVSIEDLTTDGTFGAVSTTGTVVPVPGGFVLVDDPANSVFNEYLTGITFGTTISFTLNSTAFPPGPDSSPDELSIFLLATDDMTSLISTDDPTSANSLLTQDIDGSTNGAVSFFDVSNPSGVSVGLGAPASPTPEPSAWPILGCCLLGLCGFRVRSGWSGRRSKS
jgi:hypothetical protein